MTKIKAQRVEEVDIIKAIGIICMVAGHCGAPFTRFIFLFHMALFIIASGYTYRHDSSDSLAALGKTFLKKVKRLWLPYFISSAFFTLLNNWLLGINIYTDNPELFNYTSNIRIMNLSSLSHFMSLKETLLAIVRHALFLSTATLTRSLWFLRSLFFVSLAYTAFDWLFRKIQKTNPIVLHACVSVLLLFADFFFQMNQTLVPFVYKLVSLVSYYCLFFFGTLLNQYRHIFVDWKAKQYIPALCLSFGVLLLLYYVGSVHIDLANNRYTDPFAFLAASISGWIFCYSCAYFLNRSPLKKPLLFIGKNTMCILILHVLAFKIVNAIVLCFYGLPAFCLAARPHLYGDTGLWWVAFTVIGTACPLLLNQLYEQAEKSVIRWLHGTRGQSAE